MNIAEKIRKHYQTEGDIWIVEKGKVKEAKMLKAACLKIEDLERQMIEVCSELDTQGRLGRAEVQAIESPLYEVINAHEEVIEDLDSRLRKVQYAIEGWDG